MEKKTKTLKRTVIDTREWDFLIYGDYFDPDMTIMQ